MTATETKPKRVRKPRAKKPVPPPFRDMQSALENFERMVESADSDTGKAFWQAKADAIRPASV